MKTLSTHDAVFTAGWRRDPFAFCQWGFSVGPDAGANAPSCRAMSLGGLTSFPPFLRLSNAITMVPRLLSRESIFSSSQEQGDGSG